MNIVVVGATSAIAEAAARIWAQRGDSFYLLARREAALSAIASDLRVRGAGKVEVERFDVLDVEGHDAVLRRAAASLGSVDCVLVAHGSLPDQAACERDALTAKRELDLNGTATVCLALAVARLFEQQRHGKLAVVTSVAGVRGRAANFVYGSAKAMASTAMSGLGQRFSGKGIAVIEIRPGLVDTPMTASFPKGRLWASAAQAGDGVVRAIDRNASVAYVPGFWRLVMLAIRHMPAFVFDRMRF